MRLNKILIKKIVGQALREDAACRDITTLDFISKQTRAQARIIAKENGVICGVDVAAQVFRGFDKSLTLKAGKKDGDRVGPGEPVMRISGKARSILSCERVALNFLSHLSGIATATRLAVRQVRAQGIQILDTRKTTPLLRALQKYAVDCGGGKNHRFDLAGQYLVKDNHLALLNETDRYAVLARRKKNIPFEIEVENPGELEKALALAPDVIMLDNFSPREVKKAVNFLKNYTPGVEVVGRPKIELSGGINLKNIRRYAIKGVDFISLGALTHSVKALDLSLEILEVYR